MLLFVGNFRPFSGKFSEYNSLGTGTQVLQFYLRSALTNLKLDEFSFTTLTGEESLGNKR